MSTEMTDVGDTEQSGQGRAATAGRAADPPRVELTAAQPPLSPSAQGSVAPRPWAVAPQATDAERDALLLLALAVEPGTSGVEAELGEFGAAETLQRLAAGVSPLARSRQPESASSGAGITASRGHRAADLRAACPPGVRIVLRGDPEYPTQLDDLEEPPLALWVRGPLDLRMAAMRSVAVVGARAASGYGLRVAHEMGLDLASREWTVVSGAAFGIDAAAHRGALGAPGPTMAVLACGVDIAYPRAHETLIAAIADEGAVISELPPGSAPLRFRFLARNRIIAALTRGSVVVEAAMRSGAVATANRASELARPLMAVPGPVDVVTSAGTNRLIQDGSATLVRDAGDVIEVILDRDGQPQDDTLPDEAEQVAAALGRRARSCQSIAARCQMDPALAVSMLGLLELRGRATRSASGWVSTSTAAVGAPP